MVSDQISAEAGSAMNDKIFKPSSSYQLVLPENVSEQSEEEISSFWLDGKPLLLQLSSYIRNKEKQVGARDRLRDRIGKHTQTWSIWPADIYYDSAVDQATAEFTDDNGILWIHSYLVWPHLAIYAIISGPEELVRDQNNWAIQGLKSVRLITH
jgi:hypothetical protein